jgi:hypothetical protein
MRPLGPICPTDSRDRFLATTDPTGGSAVAARGCPPPSQSSSCDPSRAASGAADGASGIISCRVRDLVNSPTNVGGLFIATKSMLIVAMYVAVYIAAMAKPEHVERDRERRLLGLFGSGGDAGDADPGLDRGDLLGVVLGEQRAQPPNVLPRRGQLAAPRRIGHAETILRLLDPRPSGYGRNCHLAAAASAS